jgi:hypothetical protein
MQKKTQRQLTGRRNGNAEEDATATQKKTQPQRRRRRYGHQEEDATATERRRNGSG